MKSNYTSRSLAAKTLQYIILIVFGLVFIVPLLWIIITSFKVDMEIYDAGGFMFFPKTWTLDNFKELLNPNNKQIPIYNWFLNSFIVSGIHTVLAVVIFSMSAYAYAKLDFKGKNVIFYTILLMSSFPQITNIIPLYKVMLTFGWLNKLIALIVPGLAGVMNIFLIRQFMYGIPDSVLESARIDGANEAYIFTKLIIPMCRPILTVVGLFSFTANWNDFLWPSVAINNIDKLTLTAGLQLAKGVYDAKVAKMSATAVLAIIPMIILFMFTRRHFENGLSLQSGVKE